MTGTEIAYDEETISKKPKRSSYHVGLAMNSSFPREVKDRLRRGAYEAFVSSALRMQFLPNARDPERAKITTDEH